MLPVFKGIGMGLVLAMAVGPVFFTLLKTSLEKGFKSGVYLAVGISINDLFFIALVYSGISNFVNDPQFQYYLGIAGGAILIAFGLFSIVRKKDINTTSKPIKSRRGLIGLVIKGFLVNGINPAVIVFWIATVALGAGEFKSNPQDILLFLACIVLTVFTTDVIKAYLANKIRRHLNVGVIKMVYTVMGLVLVGFGLRLILFVV